MKEIPPHLDPAFTAMALDIVTTALGHASQPLQLGEYLTSQMRELTGARCVVLVYRDGSSDSPECRVFSINPERRRAVVEPVVVSQLCEVFYSLASPTLWRIGKALELDDFLSRNEFNLSLIVPLKIGEVSVGALLLFGVPDETHVASVQTVLSSLSTIVGLALRNARLYERQEQLILDRTRHLQEANEALVESEAKYRTLFERAPHGVLVAEVESGRFRYANPTVCGMLGYTEAELLELGVTSIHAKEDLDFVRADFRALSRGERTFSAGVRCLRKDGSGFFADVTSALVDIDGVAMLVGFFVDVSERKRAEDLLRAAHDRLSIIFSGAHDAILIADVETGIILDANREAERLLNRPLQEIIGLHQADLHPPEHRAKYRERFELRVRHAKVQSLEGEVWTADGQAVPVEISASTVRLEDGRTAMVGIFRDIRDRLKAESALRTSEALYHSLVESLPQCIVRKDREGRLVFTNQNFCRLLGKAPSELKGKTDFDLYPVELAAKYRADDERVMETGRTVELVEVNQTGQGKRTMQVVKSPVLDAGGGVIGVQLIFWDITQQISVEEQLRQSQKLDAVGQLAGGIAHDFNNILAAMLMQLGLLRSSPSLDLETRESLKELEQEAKRAAALTRQLLLYSRREVMQSKVLNLNDLLDNLMKMLRRLLGEHISLGFQGAAVIPWIAADPGMIEQVAVNLCVNARDAMPKGGTLDLLTRVVEVDEHHLTANPDARVGRFVLLLVSDSGCGMDESILRRIFEPFFTTKEVGKGTGLGLATVYGIVKQHQGWIEVDSVVGRGTTFRVYLPLAPGVSAEEKGERASILGGDETILLVEDEAAVRRSVALFLRSVGYTVLEAVDGVEALRVWEKHRAQIALVYTDMVMPGGLSGLDLASRLRQEKPGLRVVVSSGYSTDLVGHSALVGRRLHYVPKPCEPQELARILREALDSEFRETA